MAEKLKLHYFDVFAKGPSCALALAYSGLDWEGVFPAAWAEQKPQTPWGELPVLEIPGQGMLGHELAILNYIARRCPTMGGANDAEFLISQQLCSQAEDIYQKLSKFQNTVKIKDKCTPEQLKAFWEDTDSSKHNRDQGLHVYLTHLERFYSTCGHSDGKFTTSGTTIGECKLFTSLHCLKMIKDDVLSNYAGLTAFYNFFGALESTKLILTNGGNFPGPFRQYFLE
eukprot:TRINITY_DN22874_c0_g1_i1.p1 TRINITY_DN22874_c0_g1~~TRINITY_DN22874_c0_g1_i1.p1  ORF type:complete len:227 (-),score=26.32 TRINITY_DN22874_c0_g1_i1:61-741(-)